MSKVVIWREGEGGGGNVAWTSPKIFVILKIFTPGVKFTLKGVIITPEPFLDSWGGEVIYFQKIWKFLFLIHFYNLYIFSLYHYHFINCYYVLISYIVHNINKDENIHKSDTTDKWTNEHSNYYFLRAWIFLWNLQQNSMLNLDVPTFENLNIELLCSYGRGCCPWHSNVRSNNPGYLWGAKSLFYSPNNWGLRLSNTNQTTCQSLIVRPLSEKS